jgi:hypothetical protein
LLGAGLSSAVIAAPVAVLAFLTAYFLSDGILSRRSLASPEDVGALLKDVDQQIGLLRAVLAKLPSTSAGKAALAKTCDAAQAVSTRLGQEKVTATQARRVDEKLKTCVRIGQWYQELLSGGLLAGSDQRQAELVKSIENDALPRIAEQFVRFARDLDDSEIMDLEVELKVLDQMSS